jgi:hypothetical protein
LTISCIFPSWKGELYPRPGYEGSDCTALLSRWGGWSTLRLDRFTSGKVTPYRSYKRLGGLQGRSGRVWKISPPPGFDLRTAQPVVSRYTDCAIFSKHAVFKHTSRNILAYALKTKVQTYTHTHPHPPTHTHTHIHTSVNYNAKASPDVWTFRAGFAIATSLLLANISKQPKTEVRYIVAYMQSVKVLSAMNLKFNCLFWL